MSLYKCLYLVPESEYRRVSSSGGVVEGIGGAVSDSNVNNIEVSHGGSIVIDRHSDCGGKVAPGNVRQPVGSDAFVPVGKLTRQKNPPSAQNEAGKFESVTKKGSNKSHPKDLAAKSKKLNKAKKEPNAVTDRTRDVPISNGTGSNANERVSSSGDRPYASERVAQDDLVEPMDVDTSVEPVPRSARQLEKVIARKHGQRTQKEKEQMLVDTLKVARVKELQGKKGLNEIRNDREQERQIVHELRDIYRDELKKGAARSRAGPRNVLDSGDLQRTASTKTRPSSEVVDPSGSAKKQKKGKSLSPSLSLSATADQRHGVKRAPDEDWESSLLKKQKVPSKPWLIREKRAPSPSWDESVAKKQKALPKPWLIREKRAASPSWDDGHKTKKVKGALKPWLIREKRASHPSWSTSRKKKQKKSGRQGGRGDSSDSSDDDDDDSSESSDDGNEGKYKAFLDKIANRKVRKTV